MSFNKENWSSIYNFIVNFKQDQIDLKKLSIYLQGITQNVLAGQGVGWLNVKKIRRLMECEALRLFLLQRLNQTTQDEENNEYVENIVSRNDLLQLAYA